jgi:apolipoprotein N-acyltransferase
LPTTNLTDNPSHKPLTQAKLVKLLSFSFLCGVLLCAAFAPMYAWFLAIFMPAIIFKIWQRLPIKWIFLSGFLFGAGFYTAGTSWVYQSIAHFSDASVIASLSLTILFIIYFSLYFGLLALILKRFFELKSNWQILVVFPALWVLMEYCIGHFLTGFPWLLIGYSQVTSPLHVFAPFVGVYGMSYITVFMASILAVLTQQGKTKSYLGTWALLATIVLLSVWAKHIHWTQSTGSSQKVSLVQAQLQPAVKWLPSTLTHIESTYLTMSAKHWQDSDLIIWPESALPIMPQDIQPWLQKIQTRLNHDHNNLITGIITTNEKNQYFNTAMLLSVNQKPQFVNKRHLVPFGEYFPLRSLLGRIYKDFEIPMSDLSAGKMKQPLLTYGSWRIAPYVCFEIAYPDEIIKTMHQANLLLVISDDSWFGHSLASYQHLGITQMRALETGRYVLLANDTGPSAVIKPDGSIAEHTDADSKTVLTSSVSQMTGTTPFMRWGSWPVVAWCVLMVLVSIGIRLHLNHQKRQLTDHSRKI